MNKRMFFDGDYSTTVGKDRDRILNIRVDLKNVKSEKIKEE